MNFWPAVFLVDFYHQFLRRLLQRTKEKVIVVRHKTCHLRWSWRVMVDRHEIPVISWCVMNRWLKGHDPDCHLSCPSSCVVWSCDWSWRWTSPAIDSTCKIRRRFPRYDGNAPVHRMYVQITKRLRLQPLTPHPSGTFLDPSYRGKFLKMGGFSFCHFYLAF